LCCKPILVKTKSSFNLLLLIAIVLLIYNIIKAIQVPFYWDEIYTYLRYVKPGIFILNEYDRMDANHHLLNTWLIQFFIKLFGLHEFVLRLPNILSFISLRQFCCTFFYPISILCISNWLFYHSFIKPFCERLFLFG
jgi:hypothetical protein